MTKGDIDLDGVFGEVTGEEPETERVDSDSSGAPTDDDDDDNNDGGCGGINNGVNANCNGNCNTND